MYFIRISIVALYVFCRINGKEIQIKGLVVDGNTGYSIDNVYISSIPSGAGTQTDQKGNFTFNSVNTDSLLLVQHIGYKTLQLKIVEYINDSEIKLYPRVIEFNEIDITGISRKEFQSFETENSVIEISAKELNIRSFVDVADVLFSEQSVLVNESISGQKTMSIRGAAAEEMVYMYDGVKINTMGDPLFDLSVVNVSGISGLEMVRGAHERALSSSGTVNFIPKLSYASDAYFMQRMGTYNSGSWNSVGSIGNSTIGLTGGFGENKSTQVYEGHKEPDVNRSNINSFLHFGMQKNNHYELRILGLRNRMENLNTKTQDSLGLDFQTWIGKLMASYPNGRFISIYLLSQIQHGFAYSKIYNSDKIGWNRGYGLQFQYPILAAKLNLEIRKNFIYTDWDVPFGRLLAKRSEDNLIGSIVFNGKNTPSELQLQKVKIVFSRKSIRDDHESDELIFNTNAHWKERGSQITFSLLSPSTDKRIILYGNLGTFFRIPSLQEKFSSKLQLSGSQMSELVPEFKYTREAGAKLEGNGSPHSMDYTIVLAVFSNYYNDKIKQVQYIGSSIRYPINYGRASMSGLDANVQFWSPKRNFHTLGSYSFYIFSDQIAFPLQPVKMLRAKIFYTYKGLSVEYIARRESSRVWTSISDDGEYFDNRLSPILNYDAHASYKFKVGSISISIGLTGRNLANNAQVMDGISIYDRRFYVNTEVRWK